MIVARCSFQTSHPPGQARRGECGSANGLQLASSHSARGAVRRRYLPGLVPGEKGFGNYTAALATFCRPWACPRGEGVWQLHGDARHVLSPLGLSQGEGVWQLHGGARMQRSPSAAFSAACGGGEGGKDERSARGRRPWSPNPLSTGTGPVGSRGPVGSKNMGNCTAWGRHYIDTATLATLYPPGLVPGAGGLGTKRRRSPRSIAPGLVPGEKGFGNYTAAFACSVPRLPPSPPPAAAEKAGKTKGVLAADGLGFQTRCPLGQAQWGKCGGARGRRPWFPNPLSTGAGPVGSRGPVGSKNMGNCTAWGRHYIASPGRVESMRRRAAKTNDGGRGDSNLA
jgi:hypothetical protein